MATIVFTKLQAELAKLGIDTAEQAGSNVKKAFTGGKSTSTKPGLLAAERDTGGNFATVLDIFKNDAKYIGTMNDVEQMAFLNNIMDYNEFGGKSIRTSEGIRALDEAKNLTDESSDLKTSIDELLNKAKSMKDEADAGLASAEKDLKDFLDTGGQPLKAKSDKYLGGSMHEEGQLRTAIRTFLKNEYKNGRIKLDKDDQFRIMEYSPMMEDDPIKVFKKIYGDEAYTKAGTFPGAFEKGENFTHYEKIFKENMGQDILKVKDKKYVGDGTLTLTKQEEVVTPTPDEDMPFAKGGRASFVGGKLVDEFIAMIIKKEPIEAMKEVNKIIGKKGKYKNLTQKDIDRIVDQTEDHIFQRDPDNLFVEDRPMFKQETDEVDLSQGMIDLDELNFTSNAKAAKEAIDNKSSTQVFKDSEGGIKGITMGGDDEFKKAMSEAMEEGMRESENMKRLGLNPSKMEDALKYDEMKEAGQLEKNVTGSADLSPAEDLMKKYPGMPRELAEQIAKDPDPVRKAKVLTMVEQTFELDKLGKSGDEIIDIFKKETDRTEQADGGITKLRNGYSDGNIVYDGEGPIQFDLPFGEPMFTMTMNGKLFGIYKQKNGSHLSVPLGKDGKVNYAKGGRAGYYGGGQAMVGEDLSQIGHGADALMARNMQIAPNSMATTSTGLNYLLGEDNDTVRVPYNEGNMVLPKPKPAQSPLVELSRIYKTYEEAMPGVSKDTQQFLRNDFIQKLNDAKISQEAFMTYRMQNNLAEGGPARKGFRGGGSDASTTSFSESFDRLHGTNTASRANKSVDRQQAQGQAQADATNARMANTALGREQALNNYVAVNYPNQINRGGVFNSIKNNRFINNPFTRGALRVGAYTFNPKLMGTDLRSIMQAKDIYDKATNFTKEDMTLGIVSEQQQKEIDKAATMANAMNNTGKLTDIEKTQIFNDVKPFDDKGSSGVFGIGATKPSPMTKQEFDTYITEKGYADGGIAGLRKGYAGGKGVDLARRGFLKILGGSVAAATAFKTGLVKLLGKESGAVSKKAVDEFFASGTSGAPTWFEPLVNKALKEGLDITEKAAVKDGQIVKQLDTPTGKVDVTYDTRTGAVDVDYMGGDTAMGEGLQMRYAPGDIIEEGANMGKKTDDVFEAVESIPEFQGGNYMDGPDLGFGENMTSNIDDLYSDTSELATLGGEKLLVKDISNTLKKKKVLKEMDNNPQEFAQDMSPDVYYDD